MSNDQTITTAAELDALLYAVGDCAEAAIVREPLGQPWFITEDPSGRYWADTYPSDQDARIPAKSLALPLIVIFRPDAEPARTEPTVGAPKVAPKSMHAERFGPAQAPDGFEHCGHGAQFRREADAAMAVIVPAVTAQIRALHTPVRTLERLPNGVATPWKACSCGCRTHSACPTVRLLDQIDAAVRGEGQ